MTSNTPIEPYQDLEQILRHNRHLMNTDPPIIHENYKKISRKMSQWIEGRCANRLYLDSMWCAKASNGQ
ncbi:hypothetical protein EPI10_031898 [Gossypium australe]|uniref:Uncharacterized protein n=1 Tax=Gossypium australe TaxID=47621 RepID=A0A5B6X308_9ROSI|nr:hypothetical protein EPI10_031898 [Gossypium australe]